MEGKVCNQSEKQQLPSVPFTPDLAISDRSSLMPTVKLVDEPDIFPNPQ